MTKHVSLNESTTYLSLIFMIFNENQSSDIKRQKVGKYQL